MTPKCVFFSKFLWFWDSTGFPEASWRHLGSRCQKRDKNIKLINPVLGAILGQFWSQIYFICIFCVSFFVLAFGIACGKHPAPILGFGGHCMVLLGVILIIFYRCCETQRMQFSSEMLGLGGAGRPFLYHFCWMIECVFYVAVLTALSLDFRRFVPPKGVPVGVDFHSFPKFA